MNKLHIQPAQGRRVIDPATGDPLPAEGAHVADSTYWRRRIKDKDVTRVAAPAEPKPDTQRHARKSTES
jgi:hypothetical protein